MNDLPILYSFRRCPYAIRTRMTLYVSQTIVELREVLLRSKPGALLKASPKGTVPILVLPSGSVIDESFEIMTWALKTRDPFDWSKNGGETVEWIQLCDSDFKHWLDRYKYATKFPEESAISYRETAERFLEKLEARLGRQIWLTGKQQTLADVGLFPFIRQFSYVDTKWWLTAPYPAVRKWLNYWLNHPIFLSVMNKYPVWHPGQRGGIFPPPNRGVP